MNFFEPNENLEFLLDLHNDINQIKRQGRSSTISIKIKDKKPMIDYELKTMHTTKGPDEDEFDVSLEKCSCKDFIFRRKPCKHMYKLARELKLFSRVDERSRNLIADFSKGYADGWKFIVRTSNFENLDIVWSNLVIDYENIDNSEEIFLNFYDKDKQKSKKDLVLTQGKTYNFTRGEIFYSSNIVYEKNLTWNEALKKLNYDLKIIQIDYATESFPFREIVFEDNKFINRSFVAYGIIEFSFYTAVYGQTDWKLVDKFSCYQNEFVELLKTGNFADLDGEIHNLL